MSQARKYIEETLGRTYADGVVLNLHETWSESDSSTPLICFLSMGSDPTNNIETLAKTLKLGMLMRYIYFSDIISQLHQSSKAVVFSCSCSCSRMSSGIDGSRPRGSCKEVTGSLYDSGITL